MDDLLFINDNYYTSEQKKQSAYELKQLVILNYSSSDKDTSDIFNENSLAIERCLFACAITLEDAKSLRKLNNSMRKEYMEVYCLA